MIHDYTDPNICYAIGDAVAVFMGTAATDRQPSSGVEEKITLLHRETDSGDGWQAYDGTNALYLIRGDVRTDQDSTEVAQRFGGDYNMALMITNSMQLRKPGTTSRLFVAGVQTNA